MVMYKIQYSAQALKDKEKLKGSSLYNKAHSIIDVIRNNPYERAFNFEKLVGDYAGYYSRRLNRTHRIIYEVPENKRVVRILRMWTHYE